MPTELGYLACQKYRKNITSDLLDVKYVKFVVSTWRNEVVYQSRKSAEFYWNKAKEDSSWISRRDPMWVATEAFDSKVTM